MKNRKGVFLFGNSILLFHRERKKNLMTKRIQSCNHLPRNQGFHTRISPHNQGFGKLFCRLPLLPGIRETCEQHVRGRILKKPLQFRTACAIVDLHIFDRGAVFISSTGTPCGAGRVKGEAAEVPEDAVVRHWGRTKHVRNCHIFVERYRHRPIRAVTAFPQSWLFLVVCRRYESKRRGFSK